MNPTTSSNDVIEFMLERVFTNAWASSSKRLFMKNTMSKNDAVGANKAGLDLKSFQKKKLFYETVKENMPGAKEFIDFSDMVEKAITSNIKSKAKVLLLDEAQDFTPLHWKAIYTAFKDVEEMYVAGDPMQALYRFHGGISDFMYDISIFYGGDICERCPCEQIQTDRFKNCILQKA